MAMDGEEKVQAPEDHTEGGSRADHARPIDRSPEMTEIVDALKTMAQRREETFQKIEDALKANKSDQGTLIRIIFETLVRHDENLAFLSEKMLEGFEASGVALAREAVAGKKDEDKRKRIERLKSESSQIPEHLRTGGPVPVEAESEAQDDSEEGQLPGPVEEGAGKVDEEVLTLGGDKTSVNGSPSKGGPGRMARVAKAAGSLLGGTLQTAQSGGGR